MHVKRTAHIIRLKILVVFTHIISLLPLLLYILPPSSVVPPLYRAPPFIIIPQGCLLRIAVHPAASVHRVQLHADNENPIHCHYMAESADMAI
jgi:hypothetical protein